MHVIVRQIFALFLLLGFSVSLHAQEAQSDILLADLNLGIELSDRDIFVADNMRSSSTSHLQVPNIPDSAFEKPAVTGNNAHMYLGLASMAFGALAGITAPDGYDPDLLNSVHYKAAKASWQLGAAALGTGLYYHWDDFHLEDGLLDRDNLHVILGTLGVVGYYLAVKSAVDDYNTAGYPTTSHASAGIFGGAAMLTAIAITW